MLESVKEINRLYLTDLNWKDEFTGAYRQSSATPEEAALRSRLAGSVLRSFINASIQRVADDLYRAQKKKIDKEIQKRCQQDSQLIPDRLRAAKRGELFENAAAKLLTALKSPSFDKKIPVLSCRIKTLVDVAYEQSSKPRRLPRYAHKPITLAKQASSLYRYIIKDSAWEECLKSFITPEELRLASDEKPLTTSDKRRLHDLRIERVPKEILAEELIFRLSVVAAEYPEGRFLLGDAKFLHPEIYKQVFEMVLLGREQSLRMNLRIVLRGIIDTTKNGTRVIHDGDKLQLYLDDSDWKDFISSLDSSKHEAAQRLFEVCSFESIKKKNGGETLVERRHYLPLLLTGIRTLVEDEAFDQASIDELAQKLLPMVANRASRQVVNRTRKKHIYAKILSSEKWQRIINERLSSEAQRLEAKNLLFAISRYTGYVGISLGLQPNYFTSIFRIIVAELQKQPYQEALLIKGDALNAKRLEVAMAVYKQIKKTFAQLSAEERQQFASQSISEVLPIHQRGPRSQLNDNELSALAPKVSADIDGIEVIGLYDLRNTGATKSILVQSLKSSFKNKFVRDVIFPVGDGTHWRAVHIQKPAIEESRYQPFSHAMDAFALHLASFLKGEQEQETITQHVTEIIEVIEAFDSPALMPMQSAFQRLKEKLSQELSSSEESWTEALKPILTDIQKHYPRYQVRVMGPYGQGDSNSILGLITDVMRTAGIQRELFSVSGVATETITTTQSNAFSCGHYTVAYMHYLVSQLDEESDNYDKEIAALFADKAQFEEAEVGAHQTAITQAIRNYSKKVIGDKRIVDFSGQSFLQLVIASSGSDSDEFIEAASRLYRATPKRSLASLSTPSIQHRPITQETSPLSTNAITSPQPLRQLSSAPHDLRKRVDIKAALHEVERLYLNAANPYLFDWGNTAKAVALNTAINDFIERAQTDPRVSQSNILNDQAVSEVIDSYRYFGFFNWVLGRKTTTRLQIEEAIITANAPGAHAP